MKKKSKFVEYHKYTVIGPIEEIYPETKQKLIRPRINFWLVGLKILLTLAAVGLFSWGCAELIEYLFTDVPIPFGVQIALFYILGLIISLLIFAKRIVIFFIRLYQRFGPYELRSRCIFIPNCSEYMILAIKKYGLIKGCKMGIARFNRCCAPNGGIDYP